MKRYIPILAAFGIGCTQQESSPTPTEMMSAAQTGSGTTVTLSKEDRELMSDAAQSNLYEITLGQELEKKASSKDVRAFAAKMVADHSKANEELKQLAAKKGFIAPSQLDDDQREDVEEITRLSGAELDKKYIEEMVDEHEDDVEELRGASKDADDPEIRAWAAKALGVVEAHLAEAKKLNEALGA